MRLLPRVLTLFKIFGLSGGPIRKWSHLRAIKHYCVNTATTVHTELLKILLTIDLHRSQFSPMQWATISHNGRKSPKNWLTMRKIEFVTSVSFCDFTRSMFSWQTLLPDENVIGPKVNKVSNVVWFFTAFFVLHF